MSRTYVPELDDRLVVEAATHTHSFWSGGRDFEAHLASQRGQLQRAGRDLLRYVGLVDETGLVASIKRYGLGAHVPGFGRASMVGIGAVFTRPDARGTGAASELLRHVLAEAREEGVSLALLFSDIDPAFYERFGFVPITSLEHAAKTAELPSATTLDLRRAKAEDDEAMLAFYESFWDPTFLRPTRSITAFRYFRFRNRADATYIFRKDGRDVGYVIACLHDGLKERGAPPPRALWVDEWAAPGIDLAEIYGALRRIAEQEGAEHVAGWFPLHLAAPPFIALPRKEAITMVCPLGASLAFIDPERTFFGSLDHF